MENIQEFKSAIDANICPIKGIQAFKISCLYKDICLQNYKYKPKLNICNQVIHEWEHSYKEHTLTVDIIRQILNHELFEVFSELQNRYLSESQINGENYENERNQKKIKKISEICIWLKNEGTLFKEFIDNYRLGYFN